VNTVMNLQFLLRCGEFLEWLNDYWLLKTFVCVASEIERMWGK
jgi:hypothetical protein